MSRGRRYEEPKLNIKKVFAVILAIVVIVMSVFIIQGIFSKEQKTGGITSKTYFAAYKDNKWGVIDENGDTIIDPSYEEMIIIPNNKTDVFLCTYDVNYDTGEYSTKALNSKNQEIFTEYNKVEAIANNDENQNLWYEENVLKVQKDGKWGFVDKSGFPLPIGLPTIIRGNAETGYELICGEEGLSLLEYLDKNGLLSGK